MQKKYLLILLFALPVLVVGQGVKCNFTLNSQNVQAQGTETFATMKSAITDFLNGTTWVDRPMQPFEQIECNIMLTLTAISAANEYKATLQVQAQRPVHGSAYNSVILNAIDNDAEFRFSPNEPLDFSIMSHNPNNLTPLLAYWIYIVIGMDGDSFAPMGGTEAFRTADRIVQNAQSETKPGWSSSSGTGRKTRYWLVENLLGKRYEKLRKATYTYHRLGLDAMSSNFDEGKKNILAALGDVQALYKEKPDITLFPIILFFDAKADEFVNIFLGAPKEEKEKVYAILSQTNIINDTKYKRLKE
jgi:hypothetical protein